MLNQLTLTAVPGLPLIQPGDDLGALIVDHAQRAEYPLRDGDVVVIAQKVVSKAEGRRLRLEDVTPGPRAEDLATQIHKDPRLVEIILRERAHPEQGFRASIGILRLAKTYGRERLEAACRRAIAIGARSYSSVHSILKNDLDRRRPATPADGPSIVHDNIRGPAYFN